MTFRRWEIVSVPFRFVEGHATKRRDDALRGTNLRARALDVSGARYFLKEM